MTQAVSAIKALTRVPVAEMNLRVETLGDIIVWAERNGKKLLTDEEVLIYCSELENQKLDEVLFAPSAVKDGQVKLWLIGRHPLEEHSSAAHWLTEIFHPGDLFLFLG